MAGIFPYLGGKHLLSKRIIESFSKHECYVEVFCGSAKVFFSKNPSTVEIINDIQGEIINLYRVVKSHYGEFYDHLKWLLSSRLEFDRFMVENPKTLTDIQRAVRWFYLQKQSFGGKGKTFGTSTTSKPKFNLFSIEQDLSDAHLRLSNTTIECLPYQNIIKKYDRDHTLFYLDPPYWDCENDYGNNIFSKNDFNLLANMLFNIKGNFILSINDIPEIRGIFEKFYMKEVNTTYGLNVKSVNRKVKELLISNYSLDNIE